MNLQWNISFFTQKFELPKKMVNKFQLNYQRKSHFFAKGIFKEIVEAISKEITNKISKEIYESNPKAFPKKFVQFFF